MNKVAAHFTKVSTVKAKVQRWPSHVDRLKLHKSEFAEKAGAALLASQTFDIGLEPDGYKNALIA